MVEVVKKDTKMFCTEHFTVTAAVNLARNYFNLFCKISFRMDAVRITYIDFNKTENSSVSMSSPNSLTFHVFLKTTVQSTIFVLQ